MKPLLVEILKSILKTDFSRTSGKLAYLIECDGEELVSLTRDTSLACNQKEGDEYVGVNAVDEARIEIWRKEEKLGGIDISPELLFNLSEEDDYIGFIYWTNFNNGIERVVDYSVALDEKYGLNKTLDNWEKRYELL
tara:strand:- start:185 stop:595 length:411 start_codon:yes stop_codon:yes gene_type:complete